MKYLVIIGTTVVLTVGAILNLHLVVYDGGIKVVQKDGMTFENTYVDARDLNPISWLALPRPVRDALGRDKSEKVGKELEKDIQKVGEDIQKIFK